MEIYKKICAICNKEFDTKYKNKNICAFDCRMEANRQNSRRIMRIKRNIKRDGYPPCEVCGWSLITHQHHESRTTHNLCPNHHHLITRNYTSLETMLNDVSSYL